MAPPNAGRGDAPRLDPTGVSDPGGAAEIVEGGPFGAVQAEDAEPGGRAARDLEQRLGLERMRHLLQANLRPQPAGKGHLGQRHKHTTVRTVMVSQQFLLARELLHGVKEVNQQFRAI